jgi:hypothetical protein
MIPQHYPIEVGKLYGGEYPGDRNPDVARTRLRSLIKTTSGIGWQTEAYNFCIAQANAE